jgi:hypothetical protein
MCSQGSFCGARKGFVQLATCCDLWPLPVYPLAINAPVTAVLKPSTIVCAEPVTAADEEVVHANPLSTILALRSLPATETRLPRAVDSSGKASFPPRPSQSHDHSRSLSSLQLSHLSSTSQLLSSSSSAQSGSTRAIAVEPNASAPHVSISAAASATPGDAPTVAVRPFREVQREWFAFPVPPPVTALLPPPALSSQSAVRPPADSVPRPPQPPLPPPVSSAVRRGDTLADLPVPASADVVPYVPTSLATLPFRDIQGAGPTSLATLRGPVTLARPFREVQREWFAFPGPPPTTPTSSTAPVVVLVPLAARASASPAHLILPPPPLLQPEPGSTLHRTLPLSRPFKETQHEWFRHPSDPPALK